MNRKIKSSTHSEKPDYREEKRFYGDRTRLSYIRYTLACRTRKIVSFLKEYLPEKGQGETNKILDIGCADGLMTEQICEEISCEFVLGVEKSTSFALTPKPNKVNYLYGDGCRLPLRERSFDAVLASALLKHIPTPELFIKEAFHVLKKDGLLLICDPRPLVIRLGIITRKFDPKWLFNIWRLEKYDQFVTNFGFRSLALGYYLPPMPLGKRIQYVLEQWGPSFLLLHQIGVFKKVS